MVTLTMSVPWPGSTESSVDKVHEIFQDHSISLARRPGFLPVDDEPEWRNWQTRWIQNPVRFTPRGGSTPPSGTIFIFAMPTAMPGSRSPTMSVQPKVQPSQTRPACFAGTRIRKVGNGELAYRSPGSSLLKGYLLSHKFLSLVTATVTDGPSLLLVFISIARIEQG